MKILHILSSNIFSGAENVVCQIIGMFKGDADVEMAYCSPEGTNRKALEERDINFIPLNKLNISEIRRAIDAYQPDIIHAHDMRAGFLAARACGRIPLISHIHNNAFNSRGISPKSIAYYFAAKKAKKIIWVSDSAFAGYAFHSSFKDKSIVLYNVMNEADLMRKVAEDTNDYNYDIIFVGRMSYPKNIERLLAILRIACNIKPELNIAVVGNGEEEQEVRRLATSLKLDDNVKFLGFQSNPSKMLHDSKVMVMTSRWEGTPMVALEAIALGVPIVSTPTDGLKVLIRNGENGFLSDDNEEFAKLLIKVLEDDSLREKLSKGQLARSKEVNNIDNYKATLKKVYGIA